MEPAVVQVGIPEALQVMGGLELKNFVDVNGEKYTAESPYGPRYDVPITVTGYLRPKNGWSEGTGIANVRVGKRFEPYYVRIRDGFPLLRISKSESNWVIDELNKIAKKHGWRTEGSWL